MTKEEFLESVKQKVLYNLRTSKTRVLDLTHEQLDQIIKENQISPKEGIKWIFESGLFLIDDYNHDGFITPKLREEFLKEQNYGTKL